MKNVNNTRDPLAMRINVIKQVSFIGSQIWDNYEHQVDVKVSRVSMNQPGGLFAESLSHSRSISLCDICQ